MKDNKYKEIIKYLKKILDLERIKRRLILEKLNPHEWSAFDISLENCLNILNFLNYNNESKELDEIIDYYRNVIDIYSACKYNINEIKGSIFKKGIYSDIDNLDR